MSEAWVELECPDCNDYWEANPSDLPRPDETFACHDCEARRPLSEFMRTQRDLEVVEEFHAG